MAVRYRREEEAIADALKATRRVAREASRPTATEKALTTEVAQQAAADAASAVVAANGKNRVWFTNSPPPGIDHQVGDTWFDGSSGNRINEWDGSDWVAQPFGEDAIENLAITNAKIANLDAAKIVSGSFEGKSFTGGTFTGSIFQTAVSGQRMKFDIDGLSAFNAADVQTLSLRSEGNGFVMRRDGDNVMTFSPYNGFRYSSNLPTGGDGHFILEPRGLSLTKNFDSTGPVIRLEHSTSEGGNARLSVLNAGLTIESRGDMNIIGPAGGGQLTTQFDHVKMFGSLEVGSVNALLGVETNTVFSESGITLDAPKVTVQGRTTAPGNTFATKADLDLWTDAIPGTRAWVTDTGFEYMFLSGSWKLYATNGEVDITSQLFSAYRGEMSYAVSARILTLNVNAVGSIPTGQTTVGTLAAELRPSGLKAGAARLSSDFTGTLLVNAAGAVVPSHQSGATRTAATGFVAYGLS